MDSRWLVKFLLFLLMNVLFSGSALAAPGLDWSRRYNGPAGGEDKPAALVADGSGGVVVSGTIARPNGKTGYATLKYDSEGTLLWVRRSPAAWSATAAAVALDAFGNVLVTGESEEAVLTIKYDADGNELWSRRVRSGAGYADGARAMAVSSDGALFIAGDSTPPGGKSDFLVMKMDADGTVIWASRYAGPAGGIDEVKAMAVNEYGNVAVTGRSENAEGGFDLAVVKFDRFGDEFWVDRYSAKTDGLSEGLAMALDSEANVFVAGYSEGDAGTDMVLVKLGYYGGREWVRRHDGASRGDDRATSVVLGPLGEVYVAGWSRGAGEGFDLTTLRYTASGDLLWENRVGSASPGNDRALIAVDPFGQLIVTGGVEPPGREGTGFLTRKIDTAGATLWTRRLSSGAGSDDRPVGLVLDSSTNVLVTGASQRAGGSKDFLTARYGRDIPWEKSAVTRAYVESTLDVAVTSKGVPHACFAEVDETHGQFLSHVTFDGSEWKKTMVPSSEDVESCRVAVDSADHLHFVFLNGDYLRYARFDGTTWTVETIPGATGYLALVIDAEDKPHIVFQDRSLASPYPVVYARYDGTQWIREVIDGISSSMRFSRAGLAVTKAGRAHLLVTDESSAHKVLWFTNETGSWAISEIGVGWGQALTLDADEKPHAIYLDIDRNKCMYAKYTGTRWIAASPMEGFPLDGRYVASGRFYLDSSGVPHLFAWIEAEKNALIHFKRTGSGWPYEVLDAESSGGDVAGYGKDLFVMYVQGKEEEGWCDIGFASSRR